MGADSSMYPGKWRSVQEATFIEWPEYRGESSLREVAVRLVEFYEIDDGSEVVGSSLGGMVACEIARLVHLKRLVLIGSAVHPIAQVTPFGLLMKAAGKVPAEIAVMFSHSDERFVRAMIAAIFDWKGCLSLERPVRIHGRNDMVISAPEDCDLILDAGHLVAMTHATECVEYLWPE